MKRPQSIRLAQQPLRQWASRASVVLMMTAALTLVVMSKAEHPAAMKLRTTLTDTLAPVLAVLASPMDAVSSTGQWLAGLANLHAENAALKNQNAQLLKWQAMAKDMQQENEALRRLLHVVPQPSRSFVSARVVSDVGGPYGHAVLIQSADTLSISKNQAVMNDRGLVGRVVDVGRNSARVLLLSDINSRVPVLLERTREKAILAGSNDGLPSLLYLAVNTQVAIGDRLVTSGDGGVFPAGVPVGVVSANLSGVLKVEPFVQPSKLEYVSVVTTP
ncbi:MAG: rod shape-determining protein MreC [Rickettsiales bacterium]|jgi:rod shape-determining protein MreC|nr:rod shape-determining protein MreC [Rickettsiales bacterium]